MPLQSHDALPLVMSISQWRDRVDQYASLMAPWVDAFRSRRKQSRSHPIYDFLFVYYRLPPARLCHWHPGFGVNLEWHSSLPKWLQGRHYVKTEAAGGSVVKCDPDTLDEKQRQRLEFIANLLQQTQNRRPGLGCFGLHEWAMVYQGAEVRHESTTPLRLPQSEIDAVVESRALNCTHFDAFRFFAPAARPKNRIQPTLDQRIELEQPGCIHANMDLYKWAFKSIPWIGSELLAECFELAIHAREIDMRASPYDLTGYGDFPPIKIETREGCVEYESHQRSIYERGVKIRSKMIARLTQLLESILPNVQ